jgi:hypothetical protein
MSKKKNQHLVPACYLRNFEADVSPQKIINPQFSSGVYVNNSKLTEGWKLRAVTHKSFTKSYFYNLPEDDPSKPLIENYLSAVEGEYTKHVKQVLKGQVDNENLSFLSYFVTLQFMRVDKFINMYQGAFDKVAGWMDDYDGKGKYQSILKDISKRQLVALDLGGVIHSHAAIIYNKTNFPFITSDNPVLRKQVNITDILKIIPIRYILGNINESIEFAFFFLPLSPRAAYVSCELISISGNMIFSDVDLENIFYLNYHSVVNSHEKVYSSEIEPIKGEAELAKYLVDKKQTIIKIYTSTKRIITGGSLVDNDNFKVSVELDDATQINGIIRGEEVKLIEIVENGNSVRGMRNCTVSSIDYEHGLISVESNIKFGI